MNVSPKRAAESATEMVQVVLPNDANPLGFILGGTVMHLIDIAGAIACHRHTRSLLVTAAMALIAGRRRLTAALALGLESVPVIITDRMLSKELKDLEAHHLVIRTVYDTFPPTVEYAKAEHANSLHSVMMSLMAWGILHRKKVLGK